MRPSPWRGSAAWGPFVRARPFLAALLPSTGCPRSFSRSSSVDSMKIALRVSARAILQVPAVFARATHLPPVPSSRHLLDFCSNHGVDVHPVRVVREQVEPVSAIHLSGRYWLQACRPRYMMLAPPAHVSQLGPIVRSVVDDPPLEVFGQAVLVTSTSPSRDTCAQEGSPLPAPSCLTLRSPHPRRVASCHAHLPSLPAVVAEIRLELTSTHCRLSDVMCQR